MNRHTRTVTATIAALALGVGGVATYAVVSSEGASAATVEATGEQAITDLTTWGVSYTLPEGWAMFRLDPETGMIGRGAEPADLGALEEDIAEELGKAAEQSVMLVDMTTVGDSLTPSGATTVLMAIADSEHAIAETSAELEKWLTQRYKGEVEITKTDSHSKSDYPNALVQFEDESNGLGWINRDYVVQLNDHVVTAYASVEAGEGASDSLVDVGQLISSLED